MGSKGENMLFFLQAFSYMSGKIGLLLPWFIRDLEKLSGGRAFVASSLQPGLINQPLTLYLMLSLCI